MKHLAAALFALSLALLASPTSSLAQTGDCAHITLGANGSLNGFLPFTVFPDLWNEDVTNATVDGNSDAIIATIGASTKLHPNFGAGTDGGGIPYNVVGEDTSPTPLVPVTYNQYGGQSDPGPMPIPPNPVMEGGGDAHLLVVDRHNCFLYELFGTAIDSSGNVSAASGAIFDLRRNSARPYTWTSADAAGLPIFPGLARYDEVAAGAINHALRFTLSSSVAAFVPPARHWAANSTATYAAPMGMRMRLRADFNITGYPPQSTVILKALQKYGIILADNGSSMFITGTNDANWDNDDLHSLTGLTAADFEVLQETPLYNASTVPTGNPPTILTFTATPVAADGSTTLSWTASPDASTTFFVTPSVGAVRGFDTSVTPAETTTYTLYATNNYGRSTATLTVNTIRSTVRNPISRPIAVEPSHITTPLPQPYPPSPILLIPKTQISY